MTRRTRTLQERPWWEDPTQCIIMNDSTYDPPVATEGDLGPLAATFSLWQQPPGLERDHVGPFLGTGFALRAGGKTLLVTAAHVVQPTMEAKIPVAVVAHDGAGRFLRATVVEWRAAEDLDLAVTACPSFDLDLTFGLPADRLLAPPRNVIYRTIEYSRSRLNQASRSAEIDFLLRSGSIARVAPASEDPGGRTMLELTFPTPKGASGAPLFAQSPSGAFTVVGVVLGNVLVKMPASEFGPIELKDGSELAPETDVYTAYGTAIHVRHLAGTLDRWFEEEAPELIANDLDHPIEVVTSLDPSAAAMRHQAGRMAYEALSDVRRRFGTDPDWPTAAEEAFQDPIMETLYQGDPPHLA